MAQTEPQPQEAEAPASAADGLPPLTGVAAVLLAASPDPVFALGEDGTPTAGNAAANALVEKLGADRAKVLAALAELGRPAIQCGKPGRGVLTAGCGNIGFDILVLPQDGKTALALGRDTRTEAVVRKALFESRQRYKELVEIVSDFAWETNTAGEIVFVSPKGALGFTAVELVGRRADSLLSDVEALGGHSPFVAHEPVSDVEFWARDKSGAPACLMTTAQPLFNGAGEWRGARGLSRDVTRERLEAFARSKREGRERVVAHIVEQIRDGVDPLEMLERAIEALCGALAADGAVVMLADDAGGRELVLRRGADPTVAAASAGLIRVQAGDGAETFVESGHILLVFRTRFRGGSNGVVALARLGETAAWSADDRDLAQAVEAQLGVILAQLTQQRRLELLSCTDPLTGLLNRRAFLADLDRQIARDSRDGRPGALFYIDLDNFKPLNDRLGHAGGDDALVKVAATLTANARRYDLVARLGGDEFALWLSHADQATALRRAQRISESIAALVIPGAGDLPPLGASIGVACWTPGQAEAAESILGRADRAMYAAKRARKEHSQDKNSSSPATESAA